MTPPKGYYKDLVGEKFGAWTVLSFCEHSKGTTVWLCRCKCGKVQRVKSNNLHSGVSTSCGCLKTRKGWIEEGIGYIPLTQGKVAMVSPHRVEELQKWNWYFLRKKSGSYVYRSALLGEETGHVHMARQILGMKHSDKREVDHKNRNPLDNQDCNLRPANHRQSQENKNVRRDSYTGVKGIRRCRVKGAFVGRFQARLVHMGVEIYLGTYDTLEEAKKARDEVALKLHGEFANIG